MCAKILDAMGAENKPSVIPAYNEIVLDARVAQDGDSREMLNIIRDNLYFEFGYVYSISIGNGIYGASGPSQTFGDALRRGSKFFYLEWDPVEESLATNLEYILTRFSE